MEVKQKQKTSSAIYEGTSGDKEKLFLPIS